MKTYNLLVIFFIYFIINLAPAQAINNNPTGNSSDASRAEKRAEIKERAQEQITETKSEIKSDMANRHANRLRNRFSHYSDRLIKLAAKLQERLTLLSQEGKDIAAAQTKLDKANSFLNQANTSSQESINLFTSIDPDQYESQKEIAQLAASKAKEARGKYKETLDTLKEVLSLIKELK